MSKSKEEQEYYKALSDLKDKVTEIMDRAQVNAEMLAIQLEVTKDLIEQLYESPRNRPTQRR